MPFRSTTVTELIPTLASHMIASCCFLQNNPAYRALSVAIILFQVIHFPLFTISLMDGQKTVLAKTLATDVANDWFSLDESNNSVTFGRGAQLKKLVVLHEHVLFDLLLSLKVLLRHQLVKVGISVHGFTAFLKGTAS